MMSRPPGPPAFKRCRTDGFAAYSVAFSPFFPNKLAVAGSANFGLVGNGRLSLLDTGTPTPDMAVEKTFDTQDGLYDVSWSELHENQLVTASGDGSVKLWDAALNDFPIRKWHEHSREVFCVDWSNLQKELFCTSSWDCTIKLWTPDRTTSLLTIQAHTACVYAAMFSPAQPNTIASCSTDGFLKVWDTRQQSSSAGVPSIAISAHPTEVLSLDWNKYLPHLIATGSVDRSIRIHDLRMVHHAHNNQATLQSQQHSSSTPTVASLLGHEYAVRKVAWSPHSPNLLASASYDMSARVWSLDAGSLRGAGAQAASVPFSQAGLGGARLERRYDAHTEFVVGLAWSLYEENRICTASWDQQVHIW